MPFDLHVNFGFTLCVTPPSPAISGTTLIVTSGEGALLPTPPFNAVVWPPSVLPLASNAEVVRVTGLSTDTLTIVRAQESSTAKSIAVGWQIAAAITRKLLEDIEVALDAVALLSGNGSPEGTVTASIGRFYVQQDGAKASWYKATGSGNTGWIRQPRRQIGSGSPEGVVIGSPPDEWFDSATDTRYTKKTGTDTNTGWV